MCPQHGEEWQGVLGSCAHGAGAGQRGSFGTLKTDPTQGQCHKEYIHEEL